MMINQVDDIVWGDCEDVYAAVKVHVRFTLLGRIGAAARWADERAKHHYALSEPIYKMPGGDCGLMVHHARIGRRYREARRALLLPRFEITAKARLGRALV